jgi:molybdenum cofactor synthesis domain-containing protein
MNTLAEIRETVIDSLEVEQAVARPDAGAIVQFVGRVRDHNDGRPVTLLEYEAYASMATREMRRIVHELEHRLVGSRLAVLHRVGSLQIGDAAVVCAASAPHRAEAFNACRMLIDEIKSRVPIWKREHGPDGPYWVGWEDARCVGQHAPSIGLGEHVHEQHVHERHVHERHVHERHAEAAPALVAWRILCVTVSDTRSTQTDDSGSLAERLLSAAGARVERRLIHDEVAEIQALVRTAAVDSFDAIVLTGGTGVGPRDLTPDAVQPLLTRQLEGFAEMFRRLSFDAIGTRALLSRAFAGTLGTTLLFGIPGSPPAVQLALESLIIPMLPHARAMIRGGGH